MIKVSVVVPVYNVEPFLRQCIDSLLNQTIENIEIILINDCSTDNSGAVCDEYAANDPRVRIIHNNHNLGQGLSRYKGISLSQGKYIGFVDADDFIDEDFYNELYKTAEKHNLDIVKTRRKLLFEDGKVIEKNNLNKKITKGLKKNIPLFLLFSYEHTTAIYRKDLVTNHQIAYPSIRSSEDTLFLLNITYYAKNFRLVSGPCYYYRQRQSSLTGKISQEYFNDMLCWFNEVLDFGANHKISGMDRNYFLFHAFNHMHLLSNKVSQNQVLQEYAKEFNAKILKITGKHPYASDWLIRSFINNMSFRLTRYRILLKSCLPQAKP